MARSHPPVQTLPYPMHPALPMPTASDDPSTPEISEPSRCSNCSSESPQSLIPRRQVSRKLPPPYPTSPPYPASPPSGDLNVPHPPPFRIRSAQNTVSQTPPHRPQSHPTHKRVRELKSDWDLSPRNHRSQSQPPPQGQRARQQPIALHHQGQITQTFPLFHPAPGPRRVGSERESIRNQHGDFPQQQIRRPKSHPHELRQKARLLQPLPPLPDQSAPISNTIPRPERKRVFTVVLNVLMDDTNRRSEHPCPNPSYRHEPPYPQHSPVQAWKKFYILSSTVQRSPYLNSLLTPPNPGKRTTELTISLPVQETHALELYIWFLDVGYIPPDDTIRGSQTSAASQSGRKRTHLRGHSEAPIPNFPEAKGVRGERTATRGSAGRKPITSLIDAYILGYKFRDIKFQEYVLSVLRQRVFTTGENGSCGVEITLGDLERVFGEQDCRELRDLVGELWFRSLQRAPRGALVWLAGRIGRMEGWGEGMEV